MKSMLIAAVATGIAVAGLILYLFNESPARGKLIEMERRAPQYA